MRIKGSSGKDYRELNHDGHSCTECATDDTDYRSLKEEPFEDVMRVMSKLFGGNPNSTP